MLDWPSDREGQIQRDASWPAKTFYDVCVQSGRSDCNTSPDANGDIKLVPMLEIEVPSSSYANLAPYGDLQTFGISTRPGPNNSTFAYVPLQIVADAKSGARVAFYGKMLYKPGAAWVGAHKVRLTWAIQMLVDSCQSSTDGVCNTYSAHNQLQVVQTYYDDWQLTGLNVRENRGTDYAIVYEDPSVDQDLNLDTSLIPLSMGLDGTFLSGRDCDSTDASGACVGDGEPDITINGRGDGAPTLADRFDRTRNGAFSDTQRWGIPNTTRVVTRSYAHRDAAIANIGSTEARNILNSTFTSRWSASAPITPTMLFAYEDSFRALNDSPEAEASQGMQWSGQQSDSRPQQHGSSDDRGNQLVAVCARRRAVVAGRATGLLERAGPPLRQQRHRRRQRHRHQGQDRRQPAVLYDDLRWRHQARADRRDQGRRLDQLLDRLGPARADTDHDSGQQRGGSGAGSQAARCRATHPVQGCV